MRYLAWTFGAVTALASLSTPASAEDLADTLDYLTDNMGEESVRGLEPMMAPPEHQALGMLISRDVQEGAPLDSYDCANAAADGEYTLRSSGKERWAVRACVEMQFRKKQLRGYRTMGPRPLTEHQLEPLLYRAEAISDVPVALLDAVIRFRSGRRPGLVSEDGRFGLMQLSPQRLREAGLNPGNLLDPWENIRLGALYLRKLTFQFSDLKKALAAFVESPAAVARAGGLTPTPSTLFFVRETIRLYYASTRDFPVDIAAESITFVWNWLE